MKKRCTRKKKNIKLNGSKKNSISCFGIMYALYTQQKNYYTIVGVCIKKKEKKKECVIGDIS